MNAEQLLDALENVDDGYLLDARAGRPRRRWGRMALLAAVLAALLATLGLALREGGSLRDRWIQKPAPDPVETVRTAVERQIDKEYALAVRFDTAWIDQEETERYASVYSGSELAGSWGREDLTKGFAVVRARYYVQYDHTKTFMRDGDVEQIFLLLQDEKTGLWTIVDNGPLKRAGD